MKFLKIALKLILHILTSIAIIIILLVSGAETAIYSDYNFYQKEYEKYEVLNDIDMNMKDVMYVTKEMMAYLHGNRSNLIVKTTVSGEYTEFFNTNEKLHMEDVKNIFINAIKIRNVALLYLLIIVVINLIYIFIKSETDKLKYAIIRIKKLLKNQAEIFLVIIGFAIISMGIIILKISHNFSSAFIKFHEIFFDNDLWYMNPATDNMINILPEGFFKDMSIRICLFIAIFIILAVAISTITILLSRQKKQ
ncbi:MAG: TIGR01906 family membrane protein [Eubacterium sp.]